MPALGTHHHGKSRTLITDIRNRTHVSSHITVGVTLFEMQSMRLGERVLSPSRDGVIFCEAVSV